MIGPDSYRVFDDLIVFFQNHQTIKQSFYDKKLFKNGLEKPVEQ